MGTIIGEHPREDIVGVYRTQLNNF
jgi:hypothetical protein